MTMTEVPMEEYLLDMPYEILFEIFRQLPKNYLLEISQWSSKFGDIARDTRLWKDVYIRYEWGNIPFEELYSGPSPVRGIDLFGAIINPPVSLETGQVVKVTELDLTAATTDEVTMEAMLVKYQCTKLRLDDIYVKPHGNIMGLAPEAFSQQTALELLSLRAIGQYKRFNMETNTMILLDIFQWLATVLSKYCKNLKTLDLSRTDLADLDLAFVKSLPTSLEKLYLISSICPGNSSFQWLAERLPNLKGLGVCFERVKCPALLKFKSLEALYIKPFHNQDIRDLYKYLIEYPALKKVYLADIPQQHLSGISTNLEVLRTKLKPHGISIGIITGNLE